jgi:hypothetical protein
MTLVNFLFREGQRVKVKATGEVGTVVYCSTDWTVQEVRFYDLRFDDERTQRFAESDLCPV